jgi:class 3 adenylate cyclase
VTGLPDPRKDHAIAMSRFARECMLRMQVLVRKLEVTLGPDTGDLSMRMGIHSGPVTAGVLRGERSRFQLFGDTMNTAARMEHTGVRDRIQVSQETADLLIAAGKTTWVTRRDDGMYTFPKTVSISRDSSCFCFSLRLSFLLQMCSGGCKRQGRNANLLAGNRTKG